MNYVLIQSWEELRQYYEDLSNAPYIAIDTEFMRDNTYYPELCLMQICYRKGFAIVIDCLCQINLTELFKILYDKKIVKIFHAGRQDLEIFFNINKSLPNNIFDTQIAYLALSLQKDISYEKIVKELLNINLDKTLKHSCWNIRPLSDAQINYATLDVIYLFEIYDIIVQKLKNEKRSNWLQEAFINLENASKYNNNIEKIASKIAPLAIKEQDFQIIMCLVAWREELAKANNVPRSHILPDNEIKYIAKKPIITLDLISKKLKTAMKEDLINSLLTSITEIKNNNINTNFHITEKIILSKNQYDVYIILQIILKNICTKNKLHYSLVTHNEELADFIMNPEKINTLTQGWKYNLFGKIAQDFIKQKCKVGVNDKNILDVFYN